MGLFSRSEGGIMDVIRCDEVDFLVWKWRPSNQSSRTTKKENAIRWGSSIRVKDGEVAILMYRQKTGAVQDIIVGPYDDILKTDNLPVLTGILGTVYDGKSPFQAEVYYINTAGVIQVPFHVPYFSVYDPRFHDFSCDSFPRHQHIDHFPFLLHRFGLSFCLHYRSYEPWTTDVPPAFPS